MLLSPPPSSLRTIACRVGLERDAPTGSEPPGPAQHVARALRAALMDPSAPPRCSWHAGPPLHKLVKDRRDHEQHAARPLHGLARPPHRCVSVSRATSFHACVSPEGPVREARRWGEQPRPHPRVPPPTGTLLRHASRAPVAGGVPTADTRLCPRPRPPRRVAAHHVRAFGVRVDGFQDVVPQQRYASCAVQFHPDGGQFDFVWLPARTPHAGASYVR